MTMSSHFLSVSVTKSTAPLYSTSADVERALTGPRGEDLGAGATRGVDGDGEFALERRHDADELMNE